MNTLSYRARKNSVHLRIVAYHPSMEPMPDDHLRVVFQVVERGRPIAEDPVFEENASALCLARELHLMREEGWEIEPWEAPYGH